MSDSGTLATVSEGGFSVTSNSETVDQIRQSIAEPEAEPDPEAISQAASELGKKGAAASAEARAKAKEAAQEAASEAPPEEEEPEPEPEPEKLGKPRHDPKARMLEATRQAAEAKREREAAKAEAEAAKKEAAALKVQLEAAKAPKEPVKQAEVAPGEPKAEDFETYDGWVRAMIDYRAEEKFKEREAKATHEAKVNEWKGTLNAIFEKAAEAKKEYEKTDPLWYKKVSPEVKEIEKHPTVSLLPDEEFGPEHVIADEIIGSGVLGPRLMLYLTDHPDELQRLRALPSATDVKVEMRILARSLNGAVTAGAAPKGEVSKANPPVRPVTGSPHIADVAPDDSAPYDEHRRYYNAKEKARAR